MVTDVWINVRSLEPMPIKKGTCLWKKGLDLIGEPMCHEKQDQIKEGVCHFAIL